MQESKIAVCRDSLEERIRGADIRSWKDINAFLSDIQKSPFSAGALSKEEFNRLIKNGVSFITYDFGIDGVSIEISKYASSFENIYGDIPLHFISGDFYDKADSVLKPGWRRFQIAEMNGWSKWRGGEWFSRLFYEDMPEGSELSRRTAVEMWKQAADFAGLMCGYLCENNIRFIVPVNIPTNPGNFAVMLALIMVTEGMGTYVLSSNHDFYWESGKPPSERMPGEQPGYRDHFFKNCGNAEFFALFERMYPWNGKRWIQVNINSLQSRTLTDKFSFPKEKVFELETSISDRFFEDYDSGCVKSARRRMAYILSGGSPTVKPVSVKRHLEVLDSWMANQKPVVCAGRRGLSFDPAADDIIYCLQPTRIIARKRIRRDLDLLKALMRHEAFGGVFRERKGRRIVLHVTGPVPIEHKRDLEDILRGYEDLLLGLPPEEADRVFIAFSVGTEDHPALGENGLEPLCIEDIYRLATVILFPSESEGRGLPIVESSACGIPIICSRYNPQEVFAEVVGEHLEPGRQIKYFLFPEGDFSGDFLDTVTDLLLYPEKFAGLKDHNKNAVKIRYSTEMLQHKFVGLIEALRKLG